MYYVLCIMYYALHIMHYALCGIMHYVLYIMYWHIFHPTICLTLGSLRSRIWESLVWDGLR